MSSQKQLRVLSGLQLNDTSIEEISNFLKSMRADIISDVLEKSGREVADLEKHWNNKFKFIQNELEKANKEIDDLSKSLLLVVLFIVLGLICAHQLGIFAF